MTTNVTTKSILVDWDGIEHDVISKLHLLRACWKGTERNEPAEMHAILCRDIYVPCIEKLGEFSAAIDMHAKPEDAE